MESPAVPELVEFGYNLCYGTPNYQHVVVPTDLANTVQSANGIFGGLERSLEFPPVAAPKQRDGDRRRIAAAANTVSDFGIATECGWGRGDPARTPGLLDSPLIASEGECPSRMARDSSSTVSEKLGAVHIHHFRP